jgi:hypothetical protein
MRIDTDADEIVGQHSAVPQSSASTLTAIDGILRAQ